MQGTSVFPNSVIAELWNNRTAFTEQLSDDPEVRKALLEIMGNAQLSAHIVAAHFFRHVQPAGAGFLIGTKPIGPDTRKRVSSKDQGLHCLERIRQFGKKVEKTVLKKIVDNEDNYQSFVALTQGTKKTDPKPEVEADDDDDVMG